MVPGRVIAALGLGVRGALDAPLPRALARPPFARFGDWILAALIACTAIAGCLWRRRT